MKIEFVVTDKAYLTYYLVNASKSDAVKNRRLRNKYVSAILFLVLGLLQLLFDPVLGGAFIILAISWYIFYPAYEARFYEKAFRRQIQELNFDGHTATVGFEIDGDSVKTWDNETEFKFSGKAIKEINEIGDYIFILSKRGNFIPLPKHSIAELEALTGSLKSFAENFQIPYTVDINWKWK